MIRIKLTEDDFQGLVRGLIVETKGFSLKDGRVKNPEVEIVLADIGWGKMKQCIRKAEHLNF